MSRGGSTPAAIALGLGLVGIGRAWGARETEVPDEASVRALLSGAVEMGIERFDTAPAYGSSEERLGGFLGALDRETRARLVVSTKCGELFDPASGQSSVDHSPDALRRSVDASLARLGPVALIQIHKTSLPVLADDRVIAALEAYRGKGADALGASVTDLATGEAALRHPAIDVVQLPFNLERPDLEPLFPLAAAHGKRLLVNRPFATGHYLYGNNAAASRSESLEKALAFIVAQRFEGTILMGTKNPHHLAENLEAFARVMARRGGGDA